MRMVGWTADAAPPRRTQRRRPAEQMELPTVSALRIAAATLAALLCCPVLCTAEPSIDIRFQDGHVCIDAADVTVRSARSMKPAPVVRRGSG
jgi:hypothetical protein